MNPCFDDSYPRASGDVLLEGTRERPDRRGLFWIEPDVITFVITSSFTGSTRLWEHLWAILKFGFELKNMLLYIFRLEAKVMP